jgi:hypothetical protein
VSSTNLYYLKRMKVFRFPPPLCSVRPTSGLSYHSAPTCGPRYHTTDNLTAGPGLPRPHRAPIPQSDLSTLSSPPAYHVLCRQVQGRRRCPPPPLPRRWRSPTGKACCRSSHGGRAGELEAFLAALFLEPDLFAHLYLAYVTTSASSGTGNTRLTCR